MNVLVTGGAGYIGSHACKRLLADGHSVAVIDNLFRGHERAIELLRTMPGVTPARLAFHKGEVGDRALLDRVLKDHKIDAVMHFAAMAYVGESVNEPLRYYRNNTASTLALIEAIDAAKIKRLVFSSTCASYGEPSPDRIPIAETCPQNPINPYGASKLMCERMLFDYAAMKKIKGEDFAFAAPRYFNVAGCDRSGLLGEDHEPETHLIPVILQAVLGKRDSITIFGTDYPTPDGTCIRDYVHVEDLIDAHVTVLNALKPGDTRTYNLGIGRGYSVREIIESVKRVTKRPFTVKEGPRRAGDPPTLFADPSKIEMELGWRASIIEIDDVVETAWKWFEKNPDGYTN
ncbi:MAG TPA: UDP-glucose 4-epimerase GalE [Phycisphaerales bacterium]|nr:UDP-glucose 4-epimerase GalE [Phycisphaerales bacterium]